MKRILLFFSFFLILTAVQAQKVFTPDNLPKVHLQDRTQYICNPSNILSQQACDSINEWFYALEQQTGIETVVVVVPSIGDAECFDFCHELLNSWGVGKSGKDNGLVVALVIDQRCIQFYTGYGLEGDLPDAICKRIQTQEMLPYLRDNQWDEAMMAGMKAVCTRLDGSMENDTPTESDEEGSLISFVLIFGGIVVILFFFSYIAARKATKCPQCGKHTLQRLGSVVVYKSKGIKAEDVTYICANCGHQLTRRENSYDETYQHRGGGRGPVIFGGGGRGSFRGSGGSFGGGAGGGGGAGTRF